MFFGTPGPAADCLRALAAAGHDVAAVYTRPDRVSGRSREPRPTPVKEAALELGLPVRTPAGLRGGQVRDEIAAASAGMFVVLAYGRILPAALLGLPPRGVLNVHPSLLPLYRGPSPVVTAILEGAEETGVSIMLLDEGIDSGPVLAQSPPVRIGEDDRAGELTERLFRIGVELLIDTIPRWETGEVRPAAQNEDRATATRLIEKADGELDFREPAAHLARAVRAYDPWPGAYTHWGGRLLKIIDAVATPVPAAAAPPGTASVADGRLTIATGTGALEVRRLQLEGRGVVTAAEFLRGYPALDGALLGG